MAGPGGQPLASTAPVKASDLASGRDKKMSGTERMVASAKPDIAKANQEVWVKKWVDYSSKYGLGYFLSNDATGVFFNDSTKIALDPNGYHFSYMERRTSDRQDLCKEYNLTDYPKELQKKVTLL